MQKKTLLEKKDVPTAHSLQQLPHTLLGVQSQMQCVSRSHSRVCPNTGIASALHNQNPEPVFLNASMISCFKIKTTTTKLQSQMMEKGKCRESKR